MLHLLTVTNITFYRDTEIIKGEILLKNFAFTLFFVVF